MSRKTARVNNRTLSLYALYCSIALVLGGFSTPCFGQLGPETEELFKNIKDEFDKDIADKLQEAIDKNRAWIDLTPDQLVRFRKNPINPFEGLNDIDPYSEPGNIRVEFQLPSIRDRVPAKNERQHVDTLRAVSSVVNQASQCTVAIRSKDDLIAMGTIVSSEGLIITKASEIKEHKSITCRLPNGEELVPQLLKTDAVHDIALLKVAATDLIPVKWQSTEMKPGAFVVTPNPLGEAICIGVCSLRPRTLPSTNQAHLGVQPEETKMGVRLNEITQNGSAYSAGLKPGDILTRIDSQEITTVTDLVSAIRARNPNDEVKIEYLRNGKKFQVRTKLAGSNFKSDPAARFNMMNQFGTIPSRRSNDFPWVLQHDTPLLPEHCGSPLVNLKGEVIGFNIARSGRVTSYAIPAKRMQEITDSLLRENIASRKDR